MANNNQELSLSSKWVDSLKRSDCKSLGGEVSDAHPSILSLST